MLVIVLLDGSGFNLNAHRSETEQNGAAAQSLMLIHIVHSGFELFISALQTHNLHSRCLGEEEEA